MAPRHRARLAAVVATVGCLLLGAGPASADISYIYDALGRLRAVVDPASDTAVYAYDAVGNLLAISRQASSTVAIIEVAPLTGPVGAAVTIFGTGFSPTPSQNTVTFNGVAAVVTAATATELTTSVPAGATTGPIQVTAPGGSASSAMAFPVAATSGAPTLTGFTPNLGAAGTAVSVTGTNLEPYAPANKLLLNASLAAVSAATATSLSTTVPANTGSGRFTVTTPNGTGTSAADFFIPPAGYTAPQVTVTGRLTLGQGQAVTPGPGKIALLVFDGTAGQRISITSSSSDGDGVVYRPNGSLLASWNFPNLLLDATVLPVSGTYTILAENLNTSTVTLTVYDVPADVTAPITPGGPAVPVTISTPGQNAHLLFTGALNQVISLVLGAPGFTGGLLELRQPPAGTPLVTLNPWGVLLPGFPPEQGFLERTVLPLAGEYTIDLNPYSSNTGTVTSTLYTFVDVTGTLTINGASVLVDITVPGQNARLSFAGTASQPLSLVVTGASGRPITFRVFNPDGSLHDTRFIQGHIDITLGLTPLAQTGPHTLEVDYSGPATGTVTVGLTSP